MALPLPTDPLPDLLGDLVYTSAWLEAHDDLAPHAARLDAAHADVVAHAAARNKAADDVVRKQARREVAFSLAGEALISLERRVDAHYDDDRTGYAGFFPATPRSMIAGPIGERAARLEPVRDAAGGELLPKDLAPAAKKFLGAWAHYETSLTRVANAEKAQDKAEQALVTAKTKACVAMRETHGRLETKFPHSLAKVESFFRKRASKKAARAKKKVDPATTGPA